MNNFLVEEVNRLEKVLQLLYDGERKLQSRIDAALKIAEGASLQTTSASVIGEIIAALEGE